MVSQITSAEEFKTKIQSSKLVLVDFFAVWCGPCKMIAPVLERFAAEYAEKVEIYKLDVDELSAVAQEQEVTAMPTLIFFKDGKVVDKIVGANPNTIKQKLASLTA